MARKAGVSSFQVTSRIIEVPYGFARSWLCHAAFETNTLMGAYGILSLACCHCAFLSRTRKQRRVQPAAGGDDERVYCIHRQGGLV